MNNKALKFLFVCNGIFVLAGSLLGPLYAVYVEKLGRGVLAISTSWAVFLLSTTFFMFLVSRFGDGLRKDYLLMGGFLVRAIVWFMFIFISSIPELIILQIFLGIGEAMGTPAFGAVFAEHLDKDHHVEDYADWQLVQNMMMAIGVILGGLIVNSFGFKYLFFLMSALATISFVGMLFKPNRVRIN
ncbi:MAG: MFS transporter [Candidatus Daviesbacteria bacterium]|nr:MFS transporter [Candidatus Daviesbacteria bacterium]